MNEIAITGIGAVLPTGLGIDAAWDAWRTGGSAIDAFSHPLLKTSRIARYGAISESAHAVAVKSTAFKLRRYGTRSSLWAVNAAEQAVEDSGIVWSGIDEERRGTFSGQGDYSYPDFAALRSALAASRKDDDRIDERSLARHAMYRRGADPFVSIKALANNALALTSLKLRCRGVGCAYVQNEAAAVSALNRAIAELRESRCDVALVIASGSYAEPFTLAQLWSRGLLGSREAPALSLRSFDHDASGTILGEGAVALLLERREDAERRGGPIRAIVEPGRGRATRAMRTENSDESTYAGLVPALNDGGRWAVIADGRGHPALDRVESRALSETVGNQAPIASPRAVAGVIPAAGTLMDVALATRILAAGELPPIAGLEQPIEKGAGWVRGEPVKADFDRALCLQHGFSGYHSAIVVRRPI